MTPYHVTLAAFRVLMQRLTTMPVCSSALRSPLDFVDLPDLAGHCVQFLPLRLAHDPAESGEALLTGTRNAVLDSLEHDGVTLGEI